MKKFKFLSFLLISLLLSSCAGKYDAAKLTPVQFNGRIQPFDSFARQTVKFVTGRERWQGKPATAVISGFLADREKINGERWIRIDYFEFKKVLGLPERETFFSLNDLAPGGDKILAFVRDAKAKRDRDERPSRLEQKAEMLYSKMKAVERLVSGSSHTVLLMGEVSERKIRLEVFYNDIKPFECAAAAYFLAFFLLIFLKNRKIFHVLGILSITAAIGFHTLGLGLRIYLLERPPVSNMYESMVTMNWALIVFAVVFCVLNWRRGAQLCAPTLAAASFASGLIMLYANLLPIDPSLDVLVPVLRSNYWLTIHVLTVVSSYGAFGLAMALGHRHLFCAVTRRFTPIQAEESADLIFRVIQLGTILIGTGTALGGVWANESWGRFWGWDPKETWALITFLGNLVTVHLKYAKKLSNFALAVASILGFQLVLMTWYGVNFVLGRGLHSYGAGSGGMQWVIYYLAFEVLFLAFIATKRANRGSSG